MAQAGAIMAACVGAAALICAAAGQMGLAKGLGVLSVGIGAVAVVEADTAMIVARVRAKDRSSCRLDL